MTIEPFGKLSSWIIVVLNSKTFGVVFLSSFVTTFSSIDFSSVALSSVVFSSCSVTSISFKSSEVTFLLYSSSEI